MPSDPWCPIERWEPYRADCADAVLSSGPDSTVLSDPEYMADLLPQSGPAGFVRNG